MAQRSVEGISHQTVAHGVQAGQPCLTYPFAADRESSFMKAGYGKTVRPVCAADGGKLFIGRLLRPDSDEAGVTLVKRRERVIAIWLGSTGNGRNPMFNGRRQPSRGGTSRMTRECQVRFCERLVVKFPGPTRPPLEI